MIPAQNFDIFGFAGFVILFYIGTKVIRNKKLKNYGRVLLLIATLGAIVDGYSIIANFILK
jgi:hypothetical protein